MVFYVDPDGILSFYIFLLKEHFFLYVLYEEKKDTNSKNFSVYNFSLE